MFTLNKQSSWSSETTMTESLADRIQRHRCRCRPISVCTIDAATIRRCVYWWIQMDHVEDSQTHDVHMKTPLYGCVCIYHSFHLFIFLRIFSIQSFRFFSWAGHISPPFALYLHASYILPFDFFRFVCVKSFLLSKEKDLKGENWSVYFGFGSSRRSGDISFIVWALSKYALGDLSHLGVEHDEAQSDMRGLFHFYYNMLSSS